MMMMMTMAQVMMMVCQIDLSVHLFVCDGTNQMHKLKITDEFNRSRLEINLPQFHAEPQHWHQEKEIRNWWKKQRGNVKKQQKLNKFRIEIKFPKNFPLVRNWTSTWVNWNHISFACFLFFSLFLSHQNPLLPVLFTLWVCVARALPLSFQMSRVGIDNLYIYLSELTL